MFVHPRKLDKLKKRLQHVLSQEHLDAHRGIILQVAQELAIEPLDLAAALLYASQPHLIQSQTTQDAGRPFIHPHKPAQARSVRYHLSIGSSHQIEPEQIFNVLVAESGVDRKRITRMDMRDTYTLIDLPDGMPADIFQLLNEATIGGRKLRLKRVKPGRKKPGKTDRLPDTAVVKPV